MKKKRKNRKEKKKDPYSSTSPFVERDSHNFQIRHQSQTKEEVQGSVGSGSVGAVGFRSAD